MLTRRTVLATTLSFPMLPVIAAARTPANTLVVGKAIDDLISLDPAESFEISGDEIDDNCYQRLIFPDPAHPGQVLGDVAERWAVSGDGLQFTFALRPGLRFASGNRLTAEDVAFSLRRVVMLNKSPAFIINQFGFTKDNIDSRIAAPDQQTVSLTIAEPMAPGFVLSCLSANIGSVVEKAAVLAHAQGDDLGNRWLKANTAGSGPYVLRAWNASESLVLEANPHADPAPAIRRVIIRHIADPAAQYLQLQKGDIDIARDLQSDQLRATRTAPALRLSTAPRSRLIYVGMNQVHAPLAHPGVRQAIKWAIDCDAIQQHLVFATYQVHQSFIPRGFLGAIADLPFRKDIAKGKSLLAEAGFSAGFEVTLDHASAAPMADIAQAIQADLGAVGIRVTLIAGESRQVLTKYRARRHQLALLSWGFDYFDPHNNAQAFCVNTDNADDARTKSLAWRNSWQDPDLSARAIAAMGEPNADRRAARYAALQRDHQARAPFAILLQQTEHAAMRRSVTGFDLPAIGGRTRYDLARKD